VLVTDAMTDRNAEAHANSIERVFPSLGQNTTTAEVLEFLSARRA
jgi:isochorismate hydrolase